MFFTASKIFWMLVSPLNFIFLLMLLGGLISLFFIKTGRKITLLGLFFFVLFGLFPIGKNLLTYLEGRYERFVEAPVRVDGIIILGGIFDPHITEKRDVLALGDASERFVEAVHLAEQYQNAIVVFSGGNGFLDGGYSESIDAETFLDYINYPDERFFFESESRNTYENAKFTKALILPEKEETWVLVTSAYHMPRALAVFESQGWDNIIPYPVDYRTNGEVKWLPDVINISGHMEATNIALREYIGFFVYQLTGKINARHEKT